MIEFLARFYAAFFTMQFIPPYPRDPVNDQKHGIAPGSAYTFPSRDRGIWLNTLGEIK